jgi:hypothetical protein
MRLPNGRPPSTDSATTSIGPSPDSGGVDCAGGESWPGWIRTITAGAKDRCPAIRLRAIRIVSLTAPFQPVPMRESRAGDQSYPRLSIRSTQAV